MSNEIAKPDDVKITEFLADIEPHFNNLNINCLNQLDFAKECEFAKQILKQNSYLLGVAKADSFSLKAAISNVAAIGITLNPAEKFAYLVPRKKAVCLDISYIGLSKLATDTGLVDAIKAELVYKNDTFKYKGFDVDPEFAANPFGDRGELIGVYAKALLSSGKVLVETMSIGEIYGIRDDSEAYKAAVSKGGTTLKNTVWVKYEGEMTKKTVIKRLCKTLPKSSGSVHLAKAIEVVNEHEGSAPLLEERGTFYTDEELQEYKRCVDEVDFYNLWALAGSLCAESQMDLKKICVPEADKGMKIKTKETWNKSLIEAEKQVESSLAFLREQINEGDDEGALEILSGGSHWTIDYFLSNLSTEQQIVANKLLGEGGDTDGRV